MGHYEILDHTADIGMKITGDDSDDLFYQAFQGFLELSDMKSAKTSGDNKTIELDISASDNEELLVKFVNELIRLVQEEGLAPLEIRHISVSKASLKGELVAGKIDEYPNDFAEMKSATYSMLKIKESDGVLSTPLIIDI